jgi:Arylsulfotransferase (ASST)
VLRPTGRTWLASGAVAASDPRLTRRRLLTVGGGALGSLLVPRTAARAEWLAGSDTPSAPGPYRSRPDLKPPPITIATAAQGTAPGYIFLAPFDITASAGNAESTPASESHVGPLVVDSSGEPVWFLPLSKDTAIGARVQVYRGKRSLTWYAGTVLGAYGGSYFIFDDTYHLLQRVEAGNGLHGDLHEFLITPQRTALITIYQEIAADLTSVGGPKDGRLVQGVVQEVDIATGLVVFQWESFDHVGLDESSMTQVTEAGNVDYFHLNSVDIDHDGNLLISSRHTSTIYKVDRKTGAVIWRLGGRKSDWHVEPAAAFSFQHDVRRRPDGAITLFDNGAALPGPNVASRGLRIALHQRTKHVSLVREYNPEIPRAGWAMGNVQQLDDGGVFIGWGTDGSFSEFGPDGRLRFDARFGDGSVTYRAFRLDWEAQPTGTPAIAVASGSGSTMTVYASWNGATDIARWEVHAGSTPASVQPVGANVRTGFETAITVPAARGYVTAAAFDSNGRQLGAAAQVAT